MRLSEYTKRVLHKLERKKRGKMQQKTDLEEQRRRYRIATAKAAEAVGRVEREGGADAPAKVRAAAENRIKQAHAAKAALEQAETIAARSAAKAGPLAAVETIERGVVAIERCASALEKIVQHIEDERGKE